MGRWLPGSPAEARSALREQRGQSSVQRLPGTQAVLQVGIAPPDAACWARAAVGQASASADSKLGDKNPAVVLPTAVAQQQQGFQVPTTQEGILEQTLQLLRCGFTEQTPV